MGMRSSRPAVVLPVAIVLTASLMGSGVTRAQTTAPVDLQQFFLLTAVDDDVAEAASDAIADGWRDGYAGMLRFMQPSVETPLVPPDFGNATDPGGGQDLEPRQPEHPSTKVFRRLAGLLQRQTGQRIGNDILGW